MATAWSIACWETSKTFGHTRVPSIRKDLEAAKSIVRSWRNRRFLIVFASQKMDARSLSRKLPPILKKTGEIHAIVETPKGSRNKFDFDPQTGLFELGSAMPEGVEFPFEFGFIPGTLGEDGDPLNLLILMDAPTFVGCVVKARFGPGDRGQTKGKRQRARAQ